MASSSNETERTIFSKILPKLKSSSASKKIGSGNKVKKYKKKELKLEAASVSQNFDPEAYIYPLQNRWTFDTDQPHNSHRDQDFKILKNGSASSSIVKSTNSTSKSFDSFANEDDSDILQNPSTFDDNVLRRISRSPRKETSGSSKLKKQLSTELDSIGYVPSHPTEKQRIFSRNSDVSTPDFVNTTSRTFNPMETPRSLQYNNNDDGSDAQGSSHINGYSNWNVSLINSPTPVRDTSLIPGTVPFEPGDQFDVTSELDIDRVELVADSEYGDEWSVGTPSLPALSLSSSEESIHPSSHSDFSIPVRSNFKVSHRSVLDNEVNLQLEEQRQFILRKTQILDKKESSMRRQRTKDMKLIDQRFTRIESQLITLARSVAHLSAELKSQNKMRQNISTLQKDVNELTTKRNNEMKYLQERSHIVEFDRMSQKQIRKLRKFFGEDPGHALLRKFLDRIGYEEYSSLFRKARIGIMELPYLSEQQLKDIGIPSGPACRIVENVKQLYK